MAGVTLHPANKPTWVSFLNEVDLYLDPDPTLSLKMSAIAGAAITAGAVSSVKTEEESTKHKEQKQSTIAVVATTLMTSLMMVQIKAIKKKQQELQNYHNCAFQLLTGYHSNLVSKKNISMTQFSKKIFEMIGQMKRVYDIRFSQANNNYRCGTMGVIGAFSWVIGAFAPARWLVTLGKVLIAAATCLFAFNWLKHQGDQKEIGELSREIQKTAEILRYDLSFYNQEMKLQAKQEAITTPPAGYTPPLLDETELKAVPYPPTAVPTK